jgi:tRNA A-37 threonylcarbamoyl transferase component Bud32
MATEPAKIGKYDIRGQIGRGAMGVVYEGFDPAIERRVAIKTLRLELFEPEQLADVRARFKREAQAAGQLAHPHIVTIYDYGEHEGTPYIAMEHLSGKELRHVLDRGSRLPIPEIVRLMTQLLGALSYAHERKVVHRDIKPANIFVLDDGSLKVVDFGIARVEASNLTDTGTLLGTPAYMSPEQFLALTVDERSDIFSAGVILYELLTGDKPFTGSVTTVMQKVLRQEPVDPSVLNPTLSSAWDVVIKRAMAKKPDERYRTARQFAETMKQIVDGNASGAVVEIKPAEGKAAVEQSDDTLRPGTVMQQDQLGQPDPRPLVADTGTVLLASPSKGKGRAIGAIAAVFAIGAAIYYFSSQQAGNGPANPTLASNPVQQNDRTEEKPVAVRSALVDREAEKAPAEKTEAEKEIRDQAAAGAARLDKRRKDKDATEQPAAGRAAALQVAVESAAAEKARIAEGSMAAENKAGKSRLPSCPGEFNNATWTNCIGEVTTPNGIKYVGEFKDGKRSGQGTATLPNGARYVGEFKDGKRSGHGIQYGPKGAIVRSGIWEDGEFARSE